MGYRLTERTVTVTDPAFPGLEVEATSMSVQEWMDFTSMGSDGTVTTGDLQASTRIFAQHVRSWNLEDANGELVPLPSNPAERVAVVLSQPMDLVLAVSTAWLQGVSGVSAPLEQTSDNGPLSEAVPLPMEALPLSPEPSDVLS